MKPRKKRNKFFENERLEVGRVLIDELENWKSTTTPTETEFYHLVERIYKIFRNKAYAQNPSKDTPNRS
jgi:hypothetical protein